MSSQLTQVDLDELLARQFSESSDDFEFDEEEEEEEEEIDLELEQAKLLSQQLNQKEDKPATIRKRKKNNKNYQLQKRLNARNPKKYTPKTKLKNKIAKKNNNNNNNDNNNVNNEEFPTFDERLIDNYSSIPFYREPPRVISEEELQRIKAQSIIDEANRIEREIQEVEYIEAQLIDQSREEYEKELSKQLNNLILEEQKQENEKQEIFNELEEFSTQYYQNSISDFNIKFRIQFSSGMKEFKMRSSDDSLSLKKLIIYEWVKGEREKGVEIKNININDFQFKLFRSFPRTEISFDISKSIKDIGIADCESYRIDIL